MTINTFRSLNLHIYVYLLVKCPTVDLLSVQQFNLKWYTIVIIYALPNFSLQLRLPSQS